MSAFVCVMSSPGASGGSERPPPPPPWPPGMAAIWIPQSHVGGSGGGVWEGEWPFTIEGGLGAVSVSVSFFLLPPHPQPSKPADPSPHRTKYENRRWRSNLVF